MPKNNKKEKKLRKVDDNFKDKTPTKNLKQLLY